MGGDFKRCIGLFGIFNNNFIFSNLSKFYYYFKHFLKYAPCNNEKCDNIFFFVFLEYLNVLSIFKGQ